MNTVKEVIKVNVLELVEILKTVEKSTFINLTTETEVRMNKTGNPYFGRIKKQSTCNYLIGNDYETRVQSNEQKEGLVGDFESQKPSGKTHVSKCVLVSDKDPNIFYVMVERFDEIQPKNEFFMDGNQVDKMIFNDYLVKVSENKKQDQERKVMVITPLISNIKRVSLNGNVYEVEK